VWGITGLAIVLLAVASWRDKTRPARRAVRTVAASISLGALDLFHDLFGFGVR